MMKKSTVAVIILLMSLALIMTGCSTGNETDAAEKISLQPVKQGNLQIGVYADGRIHIPWTKINFEIGGVIEAVHVEAGEMVLAGDLLAELNQEDVQAGIASAEDNLYKAQVAYEDAVSTRDYTLTSEKLKLDSYYAKYTAAFDDSTYRQMISDAEDRVKDREAALSLAETNLAQLFAEQEQIAAASAVETAAPGDAESAAKLASELDAAIAAAQKNVDAAEAALESAQDGLNNAISSLASAQARFDSEAASAEEAYELQKLKYENIDATRTGIINAEINLADARQRLNQAKDAIEQTKLYAPVSGKIVSIAYSIGDVVQAKSSAAPGALDFMMLYDPDNIQLLANVNEGDISSIEPGQEMRVVVDALYLENQPGLVTDVSVIPQVDNTGIVTYPVTGQLSEPDERILDGMSVFVLFLQKEKTDVLLVPNKAIYLVDSRQHVSVKKDDGTIETRAVTLGLTNGTVSEVIEGLTAGEKVVTAGLEP